MTRSISMRFWLCAVPGAAILFLTLLSPAPGRAQSAGDTPVRALPTEKNVVRTADVTIRGYTERDFPRITKIADNVYVYESLEQMPGIEGVFTTNCFVVVTNDGVLIADGLENQDLVKRMVSDIGKLTTQPIKYVVVGADHPDHTGGNAAFPASAMFYASTASKAILDRRGAGRGGAGRGGAGGTGGAAAPGPGAAAGPAGAGGGAVPGTGAPPRTIVYNEVTQEKTVLMVGNTEVDILNLGRGHTGGDLEVYLPAQKIMWMSEVFFNRLFPSTYSSYPSEWVAALKKAEAMNASIYLPAHGFIDSRDVLNQELVNFRMCLERLISEGKRLHDAKVPVENAARQTQLGSYSYWTRAAQNLPDGLRRVYAEADGQLK